MEEYNLADDYVCPDCMGTELAIYESIISEQEFDVLAQNGSSVVREVEVHGTDNGMEIECRGCGRNRGYNSVHLAEWILDNCGPRFVLWHELGQP
jgi:hypothetical protein